MQAFVALLTVMVASHPGDTVAQPFVGLESMVPTPGGLTASAVARRAQEVAPGVLAKRAATDMAEARADRALIEYLPRLGGGFRYARLSPIDAPVVGFGGIDYRFPVLLDSYAFEATISIPVSDYCLRLLQSKRALEATSEAARLQERAAVRKAMSDAQLIFYDLLKSAGQHEVMLQVATAAEQHARDASRLFEVGRASRADTLATSAQLAQDKQLVTEAQRLRKVAEARLRSVLRLAATEPLPLGENMEPLPSAGDLDVTQLLQEARTSRPEVAALQARNRALTSRLALAHAGYWPKISLFGGVYHANPNPRIFPMVNKFTTTWDAGLTASWAINDGLSAWTHDREATAQMREGDAETTALLDAVVLEVTEAALLVKTVDDNVASSAAALASSTEAYRARHEMFLQGRATSAELAAAKAQQARTMLAALQSRVEQRVARVRLHYAVGRALD